VRARTVDLLRDVGGNRQGEHNSYVATWNDDAACSAGGAGGVDGSAGGIAVRGGLELARGSFREGVFPVLRDGDGVCAGREEDGRVVVQGGRWRGAAGRVRPGVVDHGPNGGLGTSGAPVVSHRARGGIHRDLSGAAEGARV